VNKNVFIYSNAPLWEVHYAESIEIALCENGKGNKVFFFNARVSLLGAPLIRIKINLNANYALVDRIIH
jgi:hypothetical protein